jgi:hypothetical protein
MNYGPNQDICVGKFLPNKRWVDLSTHWSVSGPKLRHFQYADDNKDAAMMLDDFHVRIGNRVFSGLAGFDYDGSSKPALVWSMLGHPYAVGGLIQFTVHDFSYVMNLVPRNEADWLMLEGLKAFGDNGWANRNAVWTAVRAGGAFVYPKTASELCLYRDYIFLTDLGKTEGICTDERLTGRGPRISARPEIFLDWETIPLTEGLETLLS